MVVETKLLDRSRVAGEKDGEALEKIGLVENIKFAATAVLRAGTVAILRALLILIAEKAECFGGIEGHADFGVVGIVAAAAFEANPFPLPGAGGGNLNLARMAQVGIPLSAFFD